MLVPQRRFDLDVEQLQRRYRGLMAEAHPDRHGHLDAAEQQKMADHASDITDAYAVLRAPHLRAVHLLELLGTPLDEDTGGEVLGPEFLMHVMETREELEEAGAEVPRIQALRDANENAMSELHTQLGDAFASQNLDEARALTARLQYLQRIEDEAKERLPVS